MFRKNQKPVTNQFSENVSKSVQEFWQQRLIGRNGPSSSMECFVNKGPDSPCVSEKLQGFAILDTGASRSVIGSDVLPLLLEKLPDRVRNMIKKVPSKVGFRFGNNQITHSFMQVRIPIIRPHQRIWLLIEVVPKATPFLLSIQTMKTLGARIDLATNQCFLSRLGRSLTLKESKNGLYLIDMSELCLEQSEVHHVETLIVEAQASIVSNFRPPPGLDLCVSSCHAESKGSHGHGSRDGRSSHGITETSLGGPHVVDRDSQSRARSSSSDRQQCGPTIDRSPHPAEPHRRDCQDFERSRKPEAPTSDSNESRTVKEPWRSESNTNDTESHGTRGMGTGVFTCERGASDVGNKGNVDPSSARSGSWSPINFTDSDKNTECGGSSSDSSTQPSTIECSSSGSINQRSCSAERAASESAKLPDCTDLPSPGTLGKQTCFMGKEASWVPICSSVRGRSRVSNMDLGTNKKCFSTNARFHHVHQRPSGIGATSIANSDMTSSEVLVSKVQPLVKSTEELKWLNVCRHEQPVPHPIDLLEVYASDTSKLTSEVIRQGGRAKRFTKEDGDLSTFEGQCKLLKMIFRYRPKHIWMAPECAPWCQWNVSIKEEV